MIMFFFCRNLVVVYDGGLLIRLMYDIRGEVEVVEDGGV